jgi:lipoate-protein ligase A
LHHDFYLFKKMNFSNQLWRLLITYPMPGAWNMAVDEALMDRISGNRSLPCLRLYAWSPPCLSIGYAQPFKDVDLQRLASQGWDWVRRPTGGRAILHTDELTYSVIAPLSEPRISGSVLESYLRLSKPLLSALHSLKIPAKTQPLKPSLDTREAAAVCFEVPSNYEIVVDGKKLVGSAQSRRKNVLLQHGTLPLYGDLTRITSVLAYPDDRQREEAGERLLSHATTVERVLGERISWEQAANAFRTAFQLELALDFIKQELSAEESGQVEKLVLTKYGHPSWQERI